MKTRKNPTLFVLLLGAVTLLAAGCGGEAEAQASESEAVEASGQSDTSADNQDTGAAGSSAESTDAQSDAQSDDTESAEPVTRSETIDDYVVEWTVDGENVEFAVSAPTTGWVAIGFDPDRMMRGANFIIGYVADGNAVVTDQWGTGNTSHGPDVDNDGADNLIAFSGTESNGRTELRFTIPLDSGDPTDKPLTVGQEHKIILAYGNRDDLTSYHAHRTSARITL